MNQPDPDDLIANTAFTARRWLAEFHGGISQIGYHLPWISEKTYVNAWRQSVVFKIDTYSRNENRPVFEIGARYTVGGDPTYDGPLVDLPDAELLMLFSDAVRFMHRYLDIAISAKNEARRLLDAEVIGESFEKMRTVIDRFDEFLASDEPTPET